MTDNSNAGFRHISNRLIAGQELIIPDVWRQGRTAYGGLTAGLCVAAAERDVSDLPPLRSIQVTFVGPVPSNPVFTTRLLRQGKNVTTIDVKANGPDGAVCVAAICMFGAARPSVVEAHDPAPRLPDPEKTKPFFPPAAAKFIPSFSKQFDVRLIEGHPPVSGTSEAYMRVWVRHHDPASRSETDSFMALGDVLPPAASATFKQMGPISSMNWQVNFLVDDLSSDGGWYQLEIQQSAARGGYSTQPMKYWNRKGDLIAEGLQSIAIFV